MVEILPKGAELRFRLRVFRFVLFCFWLCRELMRMLHDMPELEMNDDLNSSAMAKSDTDLTGDPGSKWV